MPPAIAAPLAASSTGSSASTLIFLLLLIVVFYFLLVRPQRRRMRQHQDLVGTLRLGDEVVTIGGIVAYVKKIEDEFIHLEIADGTTIRVVKQAIARKVDAGDAAGEGDDSSGGLEEHGGADDTE